MHSFVTYAIKLGYTADQATLAISTLGSDAMTNDLLSLVISLTSSTSARRNDMTQRKSGKKTNPRTRCLGYKLDNLSYVQTTVEENGTKFCSAETDEEFISTRENDRS